MIAHLTPTTVRGVIWYQGESNTSNPERSVALFLEMICQWRRDFRQERLSFLFVQLANYQAAGTSDSYARLRESQRRALRLPATGMVVAIDIGEASDIHPCNKHEVGRRLSLWAFRKAYGMEVPHSGPLYSSANFRKSKAIVHFDYADDGLVVPGGALEGFEIAEAHGKFLPARAQPVGHTVQVWSESVHRPNAV